MIQTTFHVTASLTFHTNLICKSASKKFDGITIFFEVGTSNVKASVTATFLFSLATRIKHHSLKFLIFSVFAGL